MQQHVCLSSEQEEAKTKISHRQLTPFGRPTRSRSMKERKRSVNWRRMFIFSCSLPSTIFPRNRNFFIKASKAKLARTYRTNESRHSPPMWREQLSEADETRRKCHEAKLIWLKRRNAFRWTLSNCCWEFFSLSSESVECHSMWVIFNKV